MNSLKIYIITQLTSIVLLGLITYWLGQRSSCDDTLLYLEKFEEPVSIGEFQRGPSEDLPFPEIYSPFYLEELARYEEFVAYALTELSTKYLKLYEQTMLKKVEQYLHSFERDRRIVRANAEYKSSEDEAFLVSKNPMLSLNMIWRFSNELSEIVELLKNQPYNSRVTDGQTKVFIDDLHGIAKWPNQGTIEEALLAFLRIQMVYDLSVDELSIGRIRGVEVAPHMDLMLMYTLGTFARAQKMYTLAVPWLDLAWDTLNSQKTKVMEQPDCKVTMKEVELQLLGAITDHDKAHPGSVPQSSQHYLYRDKLQYENKTFVERRYPMRSQNWTHIRRSDNEINYWNLCSGENHKTEKEKTKLSCWYDRTSNPALTIFPIKKELLSQTPYIVQMYDVIGDSAITDIIEPVKHKMVRASVSYQTMSSAEGAATITDVVSTSRTCVETFPAHPLPKLDKFIELVTGLDATSTDSAEEYTISGYSFGGHFACHVDAFEDERVWQEKENFSNGNRVATMIFYLETTQLGGFTVFPLAGVGVKPIKGSAVLWYNMKLSGKPDEDSNHCGCPVVLGHKTVIIDILRIRNQFQRRPCGLSKDE